VMLCAGLENYLNSNLPQYDKNPELRIGFRSIGLRVIPCCLFNYIFRQLIK
jgi:hypothetical protein